MVKVSRKYAANEERTLLAAIILHDSVLERILLHLQGEKKPFRSRWSNLVAGWCFDHYQKHSKAPRKAIRTLFERYMDGPHDDALADHAEGFLEGLSEELAEPVQEMNEDFLIDMASRYFRQIKLERVFEKASAALETNNVEDAEAALTGYTSLAFASYNWTDPTDPKEIIEALAGQEHRELLQFRGHLGTFLQPHFERDAFISFVGPEKRGKSFWLMEMAWQALVQRRRVLYYVVGDMSKPQVMRRLISRALRRPLHAKTFVRPVNIERTGTKFRVTTKTIRAESPIGQMDAVKAMAALLEKTGAKKLRLKLKCCGGSSLTASDIERDIKIFTRQGWIPDVVIVDYADLLAPESSTRSQDYRHQVNETWKVMRRIAQDNHLLFITATQAAATAYERNTISKKDFSEDKRKNAHVTGMLGINQTNEEKEQCVYRLNWVFLRDGSWTDTQTVSTAGCLDVCCPCIVSTL